MQDSPFKGGRNHKAPYVTTHMRVPAPMQDVLSKMISLYKIACAVEDFDAADKVIAKFQLVVDKFDSWINQPLQDYEVVSSEEHCKILALLNHECEYNKRLASAVDSSIDRLNKANEILNHACTLKPNAGGAIKHAIREAQEHLE